MLRTAPSMLLVDFDKEAFTKILEIYASAADIKNPCKTGLDPRSSLSSIIEDISRGGVCQFRFGSKLTRHSKLYLSPVNKGNGQHISFDFDPNTSDDSSPEAARMRELFHQGVQKYLNNRPRS